jgi:hypothetical protein
LEPFHHRVCGGGAHGWKRRRFAGLAPCVGGGFGGTLLGPEGAARGGWFFGPGSDRVLYRLHGVRGLVVLGGLGFGGVFVNWIVDASI